MQPRQTNKQYQNSKNTKAKSKNKKNITQQPEETQL